MEMVRLKKRPPPCGCNEFYILPHCACRLLLLLLPLLYSSPSLAVTRLVQYTISSFSHHDVDYRGNINQRGVIVINAALEASGGRTEARM